MEKERKINWLGLFVKIIIIFIFIIIIIWLISKITAKTRLSDGFKNNIANMETVATNYFKGVDLPLVKGKNLEITLGEMIDKGLIVSNDEKKENTCDTQKSFSKITRKKSNYILETTLKCGNEKSTITKKFSFKDCKNCNGSSKNNEDNSKNIDKKTEDVQTNNNNEVNNSNSSSQNDSVTNGVTYYEYVKETTTYTKWMKGNVTGNNVENKYEYYPISNDTYYSLGIMREKDFKIGNTINYTLKLNNVPNENYYFSSIEDSTYYTNSEESSYLSNKHVLSDENRYNIPKSISDYSLTSSNFTYKLYPYYRKGNFYIDVEATIINTDGIKKYSDGNKKIYFIPLKINVKFSSDSITSNIPNGDYEKISYYRYVETKRDIIWSPDNYVEGYTKTGNTEIR